MILPPGIFKRTMNKRCTVIGDLNIDFILSGLKGLPELGREIIANKYYLDIGGSGGIFSAALSGLGIETGIISKTGDDFFGSFLIKKLESFGADTSNLIIEDNSDTGITVNLSYEKDKFQISSLKLIFSLEAGEISLKDLKGTGIVHFTSYYVMNGLKKGYCGLIDSIREKYKDIKISMDTNDDPENKWGDEIYKILEKVDIFFTNEKEAINISKKSNAYDAMNKLSDHVDTVIVKLGPRGYIARAGNREYKDKAIQVAYKDSTGAGDNFNAGYIFGLLNGLSMSRCLDIANICGGITTEYLGGAGNHAKFEKIKEKIKSQMEGE